MARTVRPRRPQRDGAGLGEHMSEIVIFIGIGIALLFAARWYFLIYQKSPTVALMKYVAAVKAGQVEDQFKLLSDATKKAYPTERVYNDKWMMAQGLTGRMGEFTITNMKETGDRAEADVTVPVRKPGQDLLQTTADTFKDHYILVKEPTGWKIALDLCYNMIKSKDVASTKSSY